VNHAGKTARLTIVPQKTSPKRNVDMSVATNLVADDRVVGIVREILERRSIGRSIQVHEDLREVGLNSLDLVNLMLSVEAEFDLKIPEGEMTLRNFRSISSINLLLASLLQGERRTQ
jgi:acyl carrier protein